MPPSGCARWMAPSRARVQASRAAAASLGSSCSARRAQLGDRRGGVDAPLQRRALRLQRPLDVAQLLLVGRGLGREGGDHGMLARVGQQLALALVDLVQLLHQRPLRQRHPGLLDR
jgi:hypothetical protein